MNTTYICDCGHPESPHADFTSGYGTDNNGKTKCYACCAEDDKTYMREHGRITLYFSRNKEGNYHVTNWPGSLDFVAYGVRKSWHNIGRVRFDFWFKFEGETWHGYQIGDFNEIAHCKRNK